MNVGEKGVHAYCNTALSRVSGDEKRSSHSKDTCQMYPKDKVNPRTTAQPLLAATAKSLAFLYNDDSFYATPHSHSLRLPLNIAFDFSRFF